MFARSSLWAACRRHALPHLTRPAGRRGYASLQERVGQSSDTPWQIAAVAVTIPGLMYLRKPGASRQGSAGETLVKQAESVKEETKAVAQAVSTPEAKKEEGIQEPQTPNQESASSTLESASSTLESASSSGSEGAPTPSRSSSGSTEMDDSRESQAQKLTDKLPSQRVDPTQK